MCDAIYTETFTILHEFQLLEQLGFLTGNFTRKGILTAGDEKKER